LGDLKNTLKIISFDVDGTLVDPEYNDLIWFNEIPQLLAKKNKISFEKAKKIALHEYNNLGEHNLDWYNIEYWISYFNFDVSRIKILEKYESQIKIFSDVIPALEELKNNYVIIAITAMPREFLTPKIKKLDKYFKYTFSAISDFKQLKNSDLYLKISQILKENPKEIVHIGDSWNSDYLAARKAGLNALYLDRSNTKKGKFIIHNLGEVKKNNRGSHKIVYSI